MQEDYEDLGTFDLDQLRRAEARSTSRTTSSSSTALRILQLTDLHLFPKSATTFQGIPLKDSYQLCLRFIQKLVQDTMPDVICFTGDIIDGRGPWLAGYHSAQHAVTAAFVDMIPHLQGVPWIYIPGNHDDDYSPWQHSDLLQILRLPGCLQSQAHGFHHTLLLQKNSGVHCVRLHLFDSGGNHPDPKIMYEFTPRRTVDSFYRYCTTKNNTEEALSIPELVYLHIPTPEYQHLDPIVGHNHLFSAALVGGKVPPMLAKLAWLIRLCKLDRIAGCRRGGGDSGLFDTCVQINEAYRNNRPKQGLSQQSYNQKIFAMFCGHDHHCDAVYQRQDIYLGYGRCGSHTPPYDWEGKAPNELSPGGRVVEIGGGKSAVITTWIQTATGPEWSSFLDMTKYNQSNNLACCLPR